jgi:hopene-associated glycosyltransferase HpnB
LLTVLSAFTLLIWIYLLFFRGFFWRVRDESMPLMAAPPRRICAVVPARNEEVTIARAVDSLRAQDYLGELQIFVVDDHSTDRTGSIASEAGATVVEAQALPPGWTGKMWAVAQGIERARQESPDYLLLTDADIEHAPTSAAALVSRAEASSLDLASYMVLLHSSTAPERLLIPAFVYFFLKLYPPAWTRDPKARTAGAAGGCILIRPAALDRIGGIAAIRGELIDDCELAHAVKKNGRIWMGLTATTRSIRVYESLGEIRAMVARTAFTQLDHSALLLAGTVIAMALTYVAPPALTLLGTPVAAALGSTAWLMMTCSYIPVLRLYRQPIWWAPLLPLIAMFYAAATVESACRYWMGTGNLWKGRVQDRRV